jgi:RAB protein geranylgeranyltransferase component A
LPFTLEESQLTPSFIILGTGLQESLIAAYLSKMEEKVGLIMDIEKTYGSCLKTVTLKEFHQLSTRASSQKLYEFFPNEKTNSSNADFFEQCLEKKAFRGYNIDIEPCLFFGNSTTCECLKQADMDKYMEFRLVNHMLVY